MSIRRGLENILSKYVAEFFKTLEYKRWVWLMLRKVMRQGQVNIHVTEILGVIDRSRNFSDPAKIEFSFGVAKKSSQVKMC